MITRSSQDWSSGSIVRVGFLRLRVLCSIATPGDFRPDVYALESLDGRSFYRFTPHHGIERVDTREDAVEPSF